MSTSIPAVYFIRSLRICLSSISHSRIISKNSIPFRTVCTQFHENAPQNPIFVYKIEDISVPISHFIRN